MSMSAPTARYFCELDAQNVVLRCIVAESEEWCVEHLGGTWAETFMDRPDKRYAGIGFVYVPAAKNYREPQPYPSWTLDAETWTWVPPVPYPAADEGEGVPAVPWRWDEATLAWVELTGTGGQKETQKETQT